MNLSQVSDKELEVELLIRKEAKRKASLPQPKPKDEINLDGIIRMALEIRDQKAKKKWDEDTEHWCYEAVMEAVFGKEYWDWEP